MAPRNVNLYHQLEEIDGNLWIGRDDCCQIGSECPTHRVLCEQEPPKGIIRRDLVVTASIAGWRQFGEAFQHLADCDGRGDSSGGVLT